MKRARSRRRRRPLGAAFVFVATALFCVGLVLFPLRSRGQTAKKEAAPRGQPAKAAPRPAPVAQAAAAAPASASAEALAPAEPPPPAPPPAPKPTKKSGALPENPGEHDDEPTIPMGKGLPVIVRTAFFFLELRTFDDTKGEFEVTTDMRLRWNDSRLQYPIAEAPRGYKEYRGAAAEHVLEQVWTPHIEPTNLLEANENVGRRVRVFANGDIETIERKTASYTSHVDAQRFPFDRQFLKIDLIVREDTTDSVLLDYEKEDVEFSRVSPTAELPGWEPGLVNLKRDTVAGWNGDRYSQISASLFVDRVAATGIAPIFIPLIASLLIPLLAIWMNKSTEEGFEIEAFELANISVGGLFSVIALSFAIYSSYGVIAGNDNTVTRLFALNYATLAMSLVVVIFFYRFGIPRRLFGRYVEEQLFLFVSWALPLLTLGSSIAFLLVAAS